MQHTHMQRSSSISAALSHFPFSPRISLPPPVCVYSGAYQLPALSDSVAITKRLNAFYSRVNPAKAEKVRSIKAQTSKSASERYWTATMIFVMRKHTYNMKQNYPSE